MAWIYLVCSAESAEALDEAGRALAAATAETLAGRGVRFDAVLSSPVGAARETAEAIARATGFEGAVAVAKGLAPGVPPHVALRAASGQGAQVAVVGHAASLAAMCGMLVGQASYGAFRPGLVIAVNGREPAWRLEPEKRVIVPLMLERK